MYRRHVRPFFEQDAVLHLIDRITDSNDLTIYTGAGLTIDMGGPSWTSLIRRAGSREEFRNRDILSGKALEVLTTELRPLEAATAVAGYYLKQSGAGNDARHRARASLISAIRSHLYPDALWDSGRLTPAVAEFVLVRALRGQKTRIVTTNYDCFLESEIAKFLELGIGLIGEDDELRSAAFPVPKLARRTLDEEVDFDHGSLVEIIYLHGRIDQDPQKPVEGHLAVTELDYGQLRPKVADKLRNLFSRSSILILGASLTDPPLMTALQDTSDAHEAGCRVAVLPVVSMLAVSNRTLDNEQTKALVAHHQTRMNEFGVSLIAPDNYAQVAQMCIELTAAAQIYEPSPDPYSRSVGLRYGTRLLEWWTSWHAESFNDSLYKRSLHRYLIHTVKRIREEFNLQGASRDEVLKLECWARWQPSTTNRALKLYASSAALWEDPNVMRSADIALVSRYVPVQALIQGKPLLRKALCGPEALTASDSPEESRWRTFLSVPIDVAVNGYPLTVGVVSLASMSADPETGINGVDAARLETITDWMRNVGTSALGLDRPKWHWHDDRIVARWNKAVRSQRDTTLPSPNLNVTDD